ncbi:hypothetical protein NM688_g4192 [Phlebia brevispora]|uniref:Uncharacterized protein n=1 Tax=Phlebia brevispora TaxID=194682 RepID=A0ACC1T3U7_9APHY|nr:hypothetical protein NM688_g4192 [Phlebia brevispora]
MSPSLETPAQESNASVRTPTESKANGSPSVATTAEDKSFKESVNVADDGNLTDMVEDAERDEKQSSADKTQVWNMVLEAMTNYDEKMVGDWKDDLQNLLVFAGLFSGVVSSFALESYGWLQEDSGDTSARLLAQISQQLTSFAVTPNFLNSTAVPTPAEPFAPSRVAVVINTLWVLSLALALIAALFAIVVQQWLREYLAPARYMSVRERVRLRQLRYQSLLSWGVPQIVSILPILIQISLVLFLVGLLYLLETTNIVVFSPFTAFLGLSLLFYITTLVMPFLFRTCPYKSPLSFVLVCILTICYAIAFITGHEYWTARERELIPEEKSLDGAALTWVLPLLTNDELPLLQDCLPELNTEEKRQFVGTWVAQALNVSINPSRVRLAASTATFFTNHMLSKIDEHFAERFRGVLFSLLPTEWVTVANEKKHNYGPAILIMLRQIAKVQRQPGQEYIARYTKRLLKIRQSQGSLTSDDIQTLEGGIVRLPTASLFECSTHLGYEFDDVELADLFKWAEGILAIFIPTLDEIMASWVDCFELCFGSSATFLVALTQKPDRLSDPDMLLKCTKIMETLNGLVHSDARRIRSLAAKHADWCVDGVAYITAPALVAIARSIVVLSNSGYFSDTENHLAATLIQNLIEVFEGHPMFVEGLDVLRSMKGPNSTAGVLSSLPNLAQQICNMHEHFVGTILTDGSPGQCGVTGPDKKSSRRYSPILGTRADHTDQFVPYGEPLAGLAEIDFSARTSY